MTAPMPETMTPREKVELKPCPFCGGDAVAGSNFDNDHYVMCGADCDRCGDMRMSEAFSKADAILTALASGSGDHAELASLKAAMSKSNDEICQSLGKALGYPWFKDDQRNFPGATEENGVCVGEHVAESIADEAASRISALLAENAALRENEKTALKECSEWARKAGEAIGKLETSEAAGIVEGWQDRATEAERKLAEAVGHMSWMRAFVPTVWDVTEERLSEIDAFLSKEAERG